LEGGFFFYGNAEYPLVQLQNEQVAKAYCRWPVDVINLSRDDLFYARKLLRKEGFEERVAKLPMIKNLISANAVFSQDETRLPAYSVKEVGGSRIRGGKGRIKIGFVGLAESSAPGDGVRDAMVNDMFQAATPAILKARKECDVLIVVAHCDLEPALKLAAQNLEADVVIAADAAGFYKTRQVANTLVITAAPGNTQEGDLRLYIDKDGRVNFKFRATDLDEMVPSDPAAAAFVETARAERDRLRYN